MFSLLKRLLPTIALLCIAGPASAWMSEIGGFFTRGGGALDAYSRPRSAQTVSFPFIGAQQHLRRNMRDSIRGEVERETRRSTAPTVAVPWTRARGQDLHRQSRFPLSVRNSPT